MAALLSLLPSSHALHLGTISPRCMRAAPLSMCDETPQPTGDWRELRARLVAQEQAAQADSNALADEGGATGFVYESPLIEQGSVILGGTKQEFGFALRQQVASPLRPPRPPPSLVRPCLPSADWEFVRCTVLSQVSDAAPPAR